MDAYISVAAASLQKYHVADISFPIFQDEVVVIIPFPKEQSKTRLISAPFSKEVLEEEKKFMYKLILYFFFKLNKIYFFN